MMKLRATWPTTSPELLLMLRNSCGEDGWEQFVSRYRQPMQNYCRRRGLTIDDAEDVTQQVFLQLIKGLPQLNYQSERGRFRGWLVTVLFRSLLKYHRQKRRFPQQVDGDRQELLATATIWEEGRLTDLLEASLNSLELRFSPLERRVFDRAFFQNHPRQDIARDEQQTVGWVYRTTFRLAGALEKELSRLADDAILGID